MMTHRLIAVKHFAFIVMISLISACSDSNNQQPIDEAFTIELQATELAVLTNTTETLTYSVSQDSDFDLNVEITDAPSHGTLAIDNENNQIQFMIGDQSGNGQFTLEFSSQTASSSITVTYFVSPSATDPDDGNDEDDCLEESDSCDDSIETPYKIYLPSDYITIFEGETIEIGIQRNFTSDDLVNEQFYFNSPLISGRLSSDKTHLIIEALEGEEDTYGEIRAVTEKEGVIHESIMYLIYYNKNRDLTSTDIPTLAVTDTTIDIPIGQSTTLNYDIYDPDSDRISYRIVDAPTWLQTHVNMTTTRLQLTLSPTETANQDDNKLIIELSDAHNVSQIEFTLTAETTEPTHQPPNIYIEKNVDLSLLVKLQGDETNLVATLTFAANDDTEDNLLYTVTPSDTSYSYRIAYPYVYIYSDDVSQLNHEQITLVASDGFYDAKLTYHLYVKNNFTEFLGGYPNSAPMVSVEQNIELLETYGILVPFAVSDLEQHQFGTSIEYDDTYLQVIFENDSLAITALPNETTQDIDTEITLIVEDEFGATTNTVIQVLILNNTAPEVSYSNEVDLIEGATAEIQITVTDTEQGELPFTLDYDENKFAIVADEGSIFVTALNVLEDYDGTIDIIAIDEFMEQTLVPIPARIRYTNFAPVITADALDVSMLPGETLQMQLTYVDPDADELALFTTVDNSNLTYSYDPATQTLRLAVSATSPYEQNFTFSTSASDGFLTTFLNINVTVPIIPTAPELTVSAYVTNISEAAELIINYRVLDINGDDVSVTITNPFPTQLTLNQQDGYIEVSVPDNVLVDTALYFDIIATDDSANSFITTETVLLNVMPVNDPPEVTLSTNTLSLVNDDQTSLPLTAVDIDNLSLNVEVRTPTSAVIPDTLVVHGADVNSVIISGATKGTVVDNQELVLRVSDDETYTEVSFFVSVDLVNEPPVFDDRVDLIQMYENSSLTFNITPTDPDSATDGDVVTILSVVSDDPTLLEIAGDPDNPNQNTVTINTLDLTDAAIVFISVTATDGYVDVLKRIQVNIDILP